MNGKKLGGVMTSVPEAELWVTGDIYRQYRAAAGASWSPGQQMPLRVVALMSVEM